VGHLCFIAQFGEQQAKVDYLADEPIPQAACILIILAINPGRKKLNAENALYQGLRALRDLDK
jgi:hypothetical protein